MPRKLSTSLKKTHAAEITRIAIGNRKLVYLLLTNKPNHYRTGKSHIAYIGTTQNGIARVASSIASHAEAILSKHGVRHLTARIITCSRRPRVATWKKLERALLLLFRERYGEVPIGNKAGKARQEGDEFLYFNRETLRRKLLSLE